MAASAQKRKTPPERQSRKEKIRDLLSEIEKSFKSKTPKATLADFIRLTQLERELEEEEQPGEIIITWAEPREKRDTGK
jgi:hypothetical protein